MPETACRPHWLTLSECPACRDLTRPGAADGYLCDDCENALMPKNGRVHWWTFSDCGACGGPTRNVEDENGVLLCEECAADPARREEHMRRRQPGERQLLLW